MNGKSQIERVEQRLNTKGYVDNFWAIQNGILRLSAIIHTLNKCDRGYVITGQFGKEKGLPRKFHKNFYYTSIC